MKTVQTKANPKVPDANIEVGKVSKVTQVALHVRKEGCQNFVPRQGVLISTGDPVLMILIYRVFHEFRRRALLNRFNVVYLYS
jgi:hypothetical protein